jgi:tetratricopeptide (TPR) repeat protein
MTTLRQLYDIAVTRLERGDLAGAEPLFSQILEQCPEDAEVMRRLAEIALEQGRYARAAELLGCVTVALPDHPTVLFDLGRAHVGLKRAPDALACLERALVLAPNSAGIYRYLSDAHFAQGRFDLALENAEIAVRLDPHDAAAHASMGNAWLEMHRYDQALACYDQSLAINPDNWQAHANRGMGLMLLGRLPEAKAALTFANALRPMQPEVALPLAAVLIDLGEYQDADLILNKLSAMMPQNPKVLLYVGINASEQGDTKSAAAALIKALSQDDRNPDIQIRLADTLVKEGKTANALLLIDQFIDKSDAPLPLYAEKARTALLAGKLDEGFAAIEAMQSHVGTHLAAPLWDGSDLTGKTILLYSQLGLGELNVLVRYARAVKQRGATVLVECTPPIHALVSAMDAVDGCALPGEARPTVDCHCPLERLPELLGMSPEEISQEPYLSPAPALVEKWTSRLADIDKVKVGIMWRKEPDRRPNIYRSVPLSAFAPLVEIEGVQLISLQTHCGLDELERWELRGAVYHQTELENAHMDARLACLAALDLFITADTLTAQVASAAGLPAWILLGPGPEWYYGADGDRSIWLPSARLFRQSDIGKWDDVMAKVVSELRAVQLPNQLKTQDSRLT